MAVTHPGQAVQIAQLKAMREDLKAHQDALEAYFYLRKNAAQCLKKHTQYLDEFLKKAWLQANIHEGCSLVAVGGYGRGEMFPYSDIDLLILLPDDVSTDDNQAIEVFVGLLWDIGLTIGHSVRSLSECLNEANQDVTVQTNLLESRLLVGNKKLYESMVVQNNATLEVNAFYDAKIKEQDNRHAKFNNSGNNLEPNIKESPGGLRDLHQILWLTRSLNLGRNWSELHLNELISEKEFSKIKRHERHLQTLRIRLHFAAKRREDRLLFDYQHSLAESLNLFNTPHKRASEQLMQGYYRSARFISLINEILLKSIAGIIGRHTAPAQSINDDFEMVNGLLRTKRTHTLREKPNTILESFLLLQQHPEISGMSAGLLRDMQGVKHLVNREFRDDVRNKKLFLAILSQENGVNHSLRRMNRYGILGEYIPAFGKIVGQMQHDLFHVYTVDEHILNVLANLRRFTKPELKHEFPLCSRLFAEFDKPHLLYLAAIFHDIAKGRGGDHSTLGTLDAKRFCKQHFLSKQDTELVAWLVEAHLKMSHAAQKSDLSDPSVIEQFARFVKTERRLTGLYLLTVADIRGTSPAVWNAWKARLLESLFNATKRVLNDAHFSVQQTIVSRLEQAMIKLEKFGLKAASYQTLWDNAGESYFNRFEADEIAWQSRLLTPHVHTKAPIVRARLSPSGDGIQVMIYTPNQDDLFARICNFFDRMAYNIAEAKIYTTKHGYALNQFIVLDQSGKSVSYSGLLRFIESELALKIQSEKSLEAPLDGRISRRVKLTPFITTIHVHKEPQSSHHEVQVITGDRPSLLAKIALIFLGLEIDLHNAKIDTLGNRAEDSFLISGKSGKVLSEEQLSILHEALLQL